MQAPLEEAYDAQAQILKAVHRRHLQLERLLEAAVDLIDHVRGKYPGERLDCKYMKALAEAAIDIPMGRTGESNRRHWGNIL